MGPPTLAESLRRETHALHQAAERSVVMRELLAGRLPRERYGALLRNLHALYAALEAALDASRDDPFAGALRFPALYRCDALARDLEALGEAQGRVTAAATDYAQRLAALAAREPPALVAHAYTRYLGDLSGGPLVARRVRERYLRADGAGAAFYDFGGEGAAQALRDAFRAALAALAPPADTAVRIVDEARWAFAQHVRLFDELQRDAAPA